MDIINELLGYELTCKMSNQLRKHSEYQEGEFIVVISEDTNDESGYSTLITNTVDGEIEEGKWEIETVLKNFSFGNWDIVSKKRI